MTAEEQRLNFIKRLAVMDDRGRCHLLRIETDDELGELHLLASRHGYEAVSCSIQSVHEENQDDPFPGEPL